MGRIIEKDFLCSYDLSEEFFEKLGIEILDIQPLRKVFILKTFEGDKILKKVDYDQNKIKFIDTSLEYVDKKFKNIMKINKMSNGKNYLKWNDDFYILMDKIEGLEAIVTNPVDVEVCAMTLAKMHEASEGIIEYLNKNESMVIRGENILEKYELAKSELIEIGNFVGKYKNKNEFDKLFLANNKYCIKQIEECIKKLKNSSYMDMISNDENMVLCHNDLAYHNFLIENDECSIIDFDYSSIDLRSVDIADLILKWIKNSTFSIDKGKNLIKEYMKIYALKEEEIELVKIFLSFPRDLYSIFRIYYRKEKNWEYGSYLSKLKSKLENDIYRLEFLKGF
ncbi:CotS family spore coat protein [uncultured Clostridium sp.]|uniref:CotS family spore coat protein n=1 Tax=uncultured Clostridium sp. TaxID=59620 RepID=UPI0026068741|nr:CotS family spore coat protein [uncultured Clostridium sp.]